MNENKDFSNILRELRIKNKVTQQELAEAMGVTPTGVSYWESKKATPNYETLEKIANYFNVTTDVLMGKMTSELETKKSVIFRKVEKVNDADQEFILNLIDSTVDTFLKNQSKNG